jgi:hypothetical protein
MPLSDSDLGLSQTLYESLIALAPDGRLSSSMNLTRLFRVLLDGNRQRKRDVKRLLIDLSHYIVPRLLEFKMVSFISRLLGQVQFIYHTRLFDNFVPELKTIELSKPIFKNFASI